MGYIYGGIAAIILALSITTFVFYQRSEIAVLEKEKAEKELSIAVEVNERNAETVKRLQATALAERKAIEKELEATRIRAASLEKISKDMDNVEGANDPAGAYWDAYGDRLRQSQRSH
jgi:hypothetical protein